MKKTWLKKFIYYNIGIGEKCGGAGASTNKNDRILVNGIGVPKEKEVSLSFSRYNLIQHPIIKHGVTVMKQQCLSKVLVDEFVSFLQ